MTPDDVYRLDSVTFDAFTRYQATVLDAAARESKKARRKGRR